MRPSPTEAFKARYEKEIAKASRTAEEVRARHILVKTKEEADAIIAELDAGGDFEAIAKEKSTDRRRRAGRRPRLFRARA
jgi:peptidyl-prolyl cis-trans isomerase C